MIRRFFAVMMLLSPLLVAGSAARAVEFGEMKVTDFEDVAAKHPAGEALKRLFATDAKPAVEIQATGLTKKDYLKLIGGEVDFWKQHLDQRGAIIDPYEKNPKGEGLEKQYSTPAFASAAALLVKEAGRDDLLEPASRAFEFALTALVNRTTANQHADFYIPMLVHAYRILHDRAPKEQAAKWETMMKSIVPNGPEGVYRDQTAGANWNVVNVSGEALRRKSGLVADDQKESQQKYLDDMLTRQQRRFTKFGMYEDPNAPLAYDAFPRLWLEEMMADGAYEGPRKEQLERFLTLGGLSSLLLLSPQGEWPNGGRSAQHQWNEAETAVICEINANKWHRAGRDDVAGSFKRAAHLAYKSMLRWQRPSGEMFIVKNRADPQLKHGFEGYSFHSQYNLLPMAMLAIAYTRADDSIAERPIPSEVGAYVFDLREKFHKVVGAAGGYYVLIDTMADEHYDATGLQRVHRRGVELSPLNGSAAEHRAYLAAKGDTSVALAPGIQWDDGDERIGLMHFHRPEAPLKPAEGTPSQPAPQRVVKNADLTVESESAKTIVTIKYDLEGPGARDVEERYTISEHGVECIQLVGNTEPPSNQPPRGFVFPVLVNDGERDTEVEFIDDGKTVRVSRPGGTMLFETLQPLQVKLALVGPRIPTHSGYVRAAAGSRAPASDDAIRWKITLEPRPWK